MNVQYMRIKAGVVFVFFVFLFVAVAVRLYVLQIAQSDFFVLKARQQYETTMSLAQPRGIIYDKSGTVPLVCNVVLQSACLFPQQMVEKPRTMAFLKKYYASTYERLVKNPRAQFLWVDRHLSSQKKKAFLAQQLKDIQLIPEPKRIYPRLDLAALIGFTDIDGKGIAGIEQEFDSVLAGKPQQVALSRDARAADLFFERRVIRPGVSGKKLCLTIDAATQYYVFQELKKSVETFNAKSGASLVIDPMTGKIDAMATYPTFDPSNTGELSDLSVTKNKAITECYELGSVMKAFTCLAALDEGVTDLDEVIDCHGVSTFINGIRVENPHPVGKLPFREVIKWSSNVATAQIGVRLGTSLYDHLIKIGFGHATGIAFPGERSGFINHPKNWSRPTPVVMTFGYEMNATLLQLARAFSIIANGGYEVTPTLVEGHERPLGKQVYPLHSLRKLEEMLALVGDKCKVPGYQVYGKTGTARIAINGRYSTKEHVYTFAGYLVAGDFKRVIVTFIERPQKAHLWASQTAQPLFEKIARRIALARMTYGTV